MHRNSKVVASVIGGAVIIMLGWTSLASAAPSSVSSRLQLAEDAKANCQLLASNPTSSSQRTRAINCINDQNAIIALLTTPTGSPSTSTSPTVSPSPSPTVTTTPSPTPTNPNSTNCWLNPGACGYPTAANTGVPTGTVLTTSSGVMNITVAGTVLENRVHTGCIYIFAANVVIRNVRLLVSDSCYHGINTDQVPATGVTNISNTEITCNYAHGNALAGPNFRATRMYIDKCENGLEMNSNSQITESFIRGSEQGSGNDPHGDGIQSQGGNNVVIRHNTLLQLNPMTSAIITNPTANNMWLVENNFFGGGAYTVYCPEQGIGFVVRNNRFVPAKAGHDYSAAYGLTDACNHSGIDWSGNYLDSNLSTVNSNA